MPCQSTAGRPTRRRPEQEEDEDRPQAPARPAPRLRSADDSAPRKLPLSARDCLACEPPDRPQHWRIAEKRILTVHDPQQAYAGEIKYSVFPSPPEEAEFVGSDIGERGMPPSECVVLGRTTRLVRDAANSLRSAGHDAYVRGNRAWKGLHDEIVAEYGAGVASHD